MDKQTLKIIFATIGVIGIAILVYMDAFLPYKKSHAFIASLRNAQNIKSFQEFTDNFSRPLDMSSPIGQEEIIKYIASDIQNTVFQIKDQNEPVAQALTGFIEPYIDITDVNHTLAMAGMYTGIWKYYGKEDYFKKAEMYFQSIEKDNPNLPLSYYNLLSLYKAQGDIEKTKEYAEKILKLWPADTNVQKILNDTAELEKSFSE